MKELSRNGILTVPFQPVDRSGHRRDRDEIISELLQLVNDHQPDLVHANSLSMSRLLGRAVDRLPIPGTGHLRDIMKLNRAAVHDLNRLMGLIAVSTATREFHLGQGLSRERCQVIHNGVDASVFGGGSWERLNLPFNPRPGGVILATIGQIGLRKAQDRIPVLLRSLLDRNLNVDWLIIGQRFSRKAESVEFESEIHRNASRLNVAEHLHWLGIRHDMPQLYREIDIVVHLARQEPFGRVLLEAAASGCAIMATRVGGTEEILGSGRDAILVPVDDDAATLPELSRLVSEADRRAELGQSARHRVMSRFTVRASAVKHARFWDAALTKKSGREKRTS